VKRKILLIVTGGIASYKALELMRALVNDSYEVNCILTKNVEKFVTKLSFDSLLGKDCFTSLFSISENNEMNHISLANSSDLILIVPCTANFIGKIANGIADDLASTVILATNKPILIAPGMNVGMWKNKALKDNIKTLKKRDITIIEPNTGKLACGQIGKGKLVEVEKVIKLVEKFFALSSTLNGKKAIVTSGPSIEMLDPVRFLSNFSSGLQGNEIAKALNEVGAETTLITGPTNLPPPQGVKVENVKTGKDFLDASLSMLPADIFISVAAICDWKFSKIKKNKIKKSLGVMEKVTFEKNVDVLKEISRSNLRPKLVIGFAAETQDLIKNSKKKLLYKRCDWIFGNLVSEKIGFNKSRNKLYLVKKDTTTEWPTLYKSEIAKKIAAEISKHFGTL
tara:strand:+ start:1935 stop:3125 length:1191 start_codon:yes stop_codon:yes gene_type:complete